MQCVRLRPSFDVMEMLFGYFKETFSRQTFIFGFKYVKCQLINFLLRQAKMVLAEEVCTAVLT